MCTPKEPCYFVERSQLHWPEMEARGYWRGEDAYLTLFDGAGDAKVIGESSTLYSRAPHVSGVAERIHRFNPDARFIYLLRNPLERSVSHYWHWVRRKRERRDMLKAFTNEPQYLRVSDYAFQLTEYLQWFDLDRFLIITSEELAADPQSVMTRVFQWLDVSSELTACNAFERHNQTPDRVVRHREGLLANVRDSALWDSVGPYVPRAIRRIGLRLAVKEEKPRMQEQREAIAYMRPMACECVDRLNKLLGREFPEWQSLYGE